MKLETFFKKFDQFADAPGAVAKMREIVVDLAIQGKLVQSEASDQPAVEILNQIQLAQNNQPNGGRKRKSAKLSVLEPNDYPFHIPPNWEWCRLGSLGVIGSSRRVHQRDWKGSGIPFFRAREIVKLAKFGRVDNDLFITEQHYHRLATEGLIPEANDIMMTGVGTIGVPYVVKETDRFYFKDASVLIFKAPPQNLWVIMG